MTKTQKRNILIGSLCAIVLLMVVGYAAFSTSLNIKGTSNISSNWNVKISGVTTKNITGTATNNSDPTFTDTSVTFKTDLKSPGDSLEYEVTVTNAGNLNAKLDKITLSDTNNPAIKFTSSGLTEGDIINAGSTGTLLVKVEFLSSVSSDPSNKTSELTVTLDYSQATSGGNTPSGERGADKLIATAVTTGDGLYIDTYEEGRYVYKGGNPNNYIKFNNEEWRILSVEADSTLKIIKNKSIGNMAWDTSNSNNWARPATLNTYLNNDYYNTLSADAQNQIQGHDFYVGSVMWENLDLFAQMESEKTKIFVGKIGLISASDYLIATTNFDQCGNFKLNNTNLDVCKNLNYLVPSSGYYWTLSSSVSDAAHVFNIVSSGNIYNYYSNYTGYGVRPALYLKSDIKLSGDGTQVSPYIIS